MANILASGHSRFRQKVTGDAKKLQTYAALAKGQKPEVLVIYCGDSRLDLRIFCEDPGKLFGIENAGNVVPSFSPRNPQGEWGTIEYVLMHVPSVKSITVLGHTDCGYCKALLHPPADLSQTPALDRWIKTGDAVKRKAMHDHGHLTGNDLVTATVKENALAQLERLREHPLVLQREKEGKLTLEAMYFDIESATVYHYNDRKKDFVPLG